MVTRVTSGPVHVVVDQAQLATLKRCHSGEEGMGWRVEGFVRGPKTRG